MERKTYKIEDKKKNSSTVGALLGFVSRHFFFLRCDDMNQLYRLLHHPQNGDAHLRMYMLRRKPEESNPSLRLFVCDGKDPHS